MISKENDTLQNVGISSEDLESIVSVIKKNKKIKKIILFGSRAKGNYKKGSDIDIAVVADSLSFDELNKIRVDIDELLLPYHIDIIDLNKITTIKLKGHILRVGQMID